MLSAQNHGRIFEDRIHNLVSSSKFEVYRENEIKTKYATHISGIDHLIIKDDLCIAIQDKYVKSKKPCIVDINHFKSCVNDLSSILDTKITGMYVSLLQPTLPAEKSIKFENDKEGNEFVFINNENEDDLVTDIIRYLYENKIWLYDGDDVYMNGVEHFF